MKRALVLEGGTMRGAFIVGALKVIHKELGSRYFDGIFSNSVGVFEQASFAAGQIKEMENTWRDYVHGRKLISVLKPLQGKAILDLDYLVDLFQSDKARMDIEALRSSPYELITLAADYETKEVVSLNLKEGDIFTAMKATCAIPSIYPRKIFINGRRYVDCLIAPYENFLSALEKSLEGYDEVVCVSTYKDCDPRLEEMVDFIVRPSAMPLWGALDTNRKRILRTIAQGEKDAAQFIENLKGSVKSSG